MARANSGYRIIPKLITLGQPWKRAALIDEAGQGRVARREYPDQPRDLPVLVLNLHGIDHADKILLRMDIELAIHVPHMGVGRAC